MTRFAIALGSNLGDRIAHLRYAVSAISALGEIVAISSLYRSAPVGGPEQPDYFNAVLVLSTDLDGPTLLARLQAVEAGAGRTREVRWGPRTLDLDIVASDGPDIDLPGLQVPHPRAGERRFVLEPLAEIWPQAHVSLGVESQSALTGVAYQEVDLVEGPWFLPNEADPELNNPGL